MATGAPLLMALTLKPPSSISLPQQTLDMPSGEQKELVVRGRHDPVLGPRAVPVAEAMCKLVISDMILGGGRQDE